jgi:hypothetical protein
MAHLSRRRLLLVVRRFVCVHAVCRVWCDGVVYAILVLRVFVVLLVLCELWCLASIICFLRDVCSMRSYSSVGRAQC